MTLAEVRPDSAYISNSAKGDEEKYRVAKEGLIYTIKQGSEATFFPGRAADIMLKKGEGDFQKIGSFGIVHPETLQHFDVHYPCSAVELNIEEIM